jgi:hypothetical protein
LARFLVPPDFPVFAVFDFFVTGTFFEAVLEVAFFFLTLTVFGADFFAVDPLLLFAPLDDFFLPVTDFKAFSALPSLISERIVSTALLTGFCPRADESPTIAPAIPPAIAPTGPATIAPSTAPVTPPAVCFDTGTFFAVLRCADALLLFVFLGMIDFQCVRDYQEPLVAT